MGLLERPADLPERLGERGGREHVNGGRRGFGGMGGKGGHAEHGERETERGVHCVEAPFAIMTSVDLTTANTGSPTWSRKRSAELRVMIATSSWSPIPMRTSAIKPSMLKPTTRPRS